MVGKEYKNILSEEQCTKIKDSMLRLKESNSLNVESDTKFYNGSLGTANLPESLEYLPQVQSKIFEDFSGLVFSNTYTRIYPKHSILNIHTDRPGLDFTLTVCIFSNLSISWPIYFSNVEYTDDVWRLDVDESIYKNDYSTYHTPPGCGAAEYGILFPHWRDKLLCNDGEYVIQTFYHWTKK